MAPIAHPSLAAQGAKSTNYQPQITRAGEFNSVVALFPSSSLLHIRDNEVS